MVRTYRSEWSWPSSIPLEVRISSWEALTAADDGGDDDDEEEDAEEEEEGGRRRRSSSARSRWTSKTGWSSRSDMRPLATAGRASGGEPSGDMWNDTQPAFWGRGPAAAGLDAGGLFVMAFFAVGGERGADLELAALGWAFAAGGMELRIGGSPGPLEGEAKRPGALPSLTGVEP